MNIRTNMPKKPVIYFAGKIARYDWRVEITGDDRVGGLPDNGGAPIEGMFDPDYRVEYDSFFYGGPFFVSCDHGCGHAQAHALGGCGGEEAVVIQGFSASTISAFSRRTTCSPSSTRSIVSVP
jgi:hypothetical protein